MTRPLRRWAPGLICFAILAHPVVAGNICPPPPNPAGKCSLDIDRSLLTEFDADGNGFADAEGSGGDFCNGSSPADCGGYPAPEIAFDLQITDPARQDVTCTMLGASVWIMSDGCNACLASGFDSATLPAGSTTDSTLKVVVSDDNGDVCFCAGPLRCSFSVEAECSDGGDGDGDGLVDNDDPDCCPDADEDGFCSPDDCDDENPTVHELPPLVDPLLMSVVDGDTFILWNAGQETFADIVTGFVADLRGDGGFSGAICLVEGEPPASFWDSRLSPAPGQAYYYLARLENACGSSGYGASSEGVGARSALNAASPCPL